MRLPIKLNKSGWSPFFADSFIAHADPRPLAIRASALTADQFSASVSSLQFGVTFKTTHRGRHAYSNEYISNLYEGTQPVILDVGASDGSTSLDLIKALRTNFSRYYVTDLNLSVRWGTDPNGIGYFLDGSGRCILRVSERFLVYANAGKARLPVRTLARAFGLIARILLAQHRVVNNWRDIVLVQPDLVKLARDDERIEIQRYDMFMPWRGTPPDLIKIANLLNNEYFTDAELERALSVQCTNLASGGRLLLISEDDDLEKYSVFRKTTAGMVLERSHVGGAKPARLVQRIYP